MRSKFAEMKASRKRPGNSHKPAEPGKTNDNLTALSILPAVMLLVAGTFLTVPFGFDVFKQIDPGIPFLLAAGGDQVRCVSRKAVVSAQGSSRVLPANSG